MFPRAAFCYETSQTPAQCPGTVRPAMPLPPKGSLGLMARPCIVAPSEPNRGRSKVTDAKCLVTKAPVAPRFLLAV